MGWCVKKSAIRSGNAALLSMGWDFDMKSELQYYSCFWKMASNDSITPSGKIGGYMLLLSHAPRVTEFVGGNCKRTCSFSLWLQHTLLWAPWESLQIRNSVMSTASWLENLNVHVKCLKTQFEEVIVGKMIISSISCQLMVFEIWSLSKGWWKQLYSISAL